MDSLMIIAIGALAVMILLLWLWETKTFPDLTEKDMRPVFLENISTGNESKVVEGPIPVGKNFHFFLVNDPNIPFSIPIKNTFHENPISPHINTSGKKKFYYIPDHMLNHKILKRLNMGNKHTTEMLKLNNAMLKAEKKEIAKNVYGMNKMDLKLLADVKSDIMFAKPDSDKKGGHD